jgi:RNA polymerase sigma-70 factor (ECF subfamily)
MSLQTCSQQNWEDNDTTSDDDGALPERDVQRLLDTLAAGNHAAFWPLWDLYKGHLYHVCLWQMDGVREDAEDALSRSMLRALDKLPRMCGRIQNVGAWLSRLTVNLCVDMHREQKRDARRLENIDDVLPAAGEVLQADADSPETVYLNREAIDYVCGVVNDLPPRLREPFALRFFQEMAYCDIAARLILTTDNVRKRIQQARDILRQRMIALDR